MRKRRSLLLVACTTLLLSFGAAACGGGDDDPADTGTSGDVVADTESDAGMDAEPDAEPPEDVEPDTPDDKQDTDVEQDVSDETDAGDEEDTGPDPDELDSDSDGLTNAEEQQLCNGNGSDPYDGDTDGDGLSDYEEVQRGTNPCKQDTDGDGASDWEELQWDLNPTNPDTYNDGTIDGDRWILSACENQTPSEVDFYENAEGNWSVALPTAFGNYTDLSITNSSAPLAAAAYDDPANEVAGFMLSENNPTSASSPQQPLATQPAGQVYQALQSISSVDQDLTQGEFQTHDGYTASTGEYEVTVNGGAVSVKKFRDDLLLEAAPFSQGDVSGLPSSAGATYDQFKVIITVIFRPNLNGPAQRLVTAGVAPLKKVARDSPQYSPFLRFRMNDLTDTTNIAEEVDTSLTKCARFTADADRPQAEFYWVLDQSGSMSDDNQKVIDFSDNFIQEIENTALDYRLGVTNMDPSTEGRLRAPTYWHKASSTFKSQVDGMAINCSGDGTIGCSGGSEYGLKNGREGIRYMTGGASQQPSPPEEIRADAEVITIFMSDEEANSAKLNDWGMVDGISNVGDFELWYQNKTTAFAIVGDGQSCGTDNGQAYKDVALATGGKTASLCASDLTQTIQDIIFAATGVASNYNPKPRPISSSLKVFMNGTFVPRSEEDGYNYFAKDNAVAFFGNFRPDPDKAEDPTVAPDRVAIVYETYKDKCKESGNGAFNCSNNN